MIKETIRGTAREYFRPIVWLWKFAKERAGSPTDTPGPASSPSSAGKESTGAERYFAEKRDNPEYDAAYQAARWANNWRDIADALVYGFKVGDSESEEMALNRYWGAGGHVLNDHIGSIPGPGVDAGLAGASNPVDGDRHTRMPHRPESTSDVSHDGPCDFRFVAPLPHNAAVDVGCNAPKGHDGPHRYKDNWTGGDTYVLAATDSAGLDEVCVVIYPDPKAKTLSYIFGVFRSKDEATKAYLAEGPAEEMPPSFVTLPVHDSQGNADG